MSIDNTNSSSRLTVIVKDGGVDTNDADTPCTVRMSGNLGIDLGLLSFRQSGRIMDLEAR